MTFRNIRFCCLLLSCCYSSGGCYPLLYNSSGRRGRRPLLSFYTAGHDAVLEVFLGKTVYHDDRDHGNERARHEDVVLGGVLAVERGQRDGQGHLVLVGEHQERPEIVVPRLHKRGDGERCESRRAQRKSHLPIDLEYRRAVNARGIQIVVRDRPHLLNEQKHSERPKYGRKDHAAVGVDETELIHHDEQRDDRDLRGDHHGRKKDFQQEIRRGEAELCKGKGRHGRGQERDKGIDHADEKTVAYCFQKREFGEDLYVGLERGLLRDPFDGNRHQRPSRLEGGGQHPEKRYHRQNGDYGRNGVIAHRAEAFFMRHSSPTVSAPEAGEPYKA